MQTTIKIWSLFQAQKIQESTTTMLVACCLYSYVQFNQCQEFLHRLKVEEILRLILHKYSAQIGYVHFQHYFKQAMGCNYPERVLTPVRPTCAV